ncbi:MAG: ATP-dependent helicase, partial [Saprospiraceae bacterium]|nr:ATP-dependent helicase [Saprospiraceae bacterium]MCF8252747.1 ATP-dependent helicase [Saprospiraceae bacterium]MCF8283119.1 ATP-dependent helicase [Bacteroidales bacterium]MCF8314317.1 ATP-dependent helicase [Saprospiraceae bacterium]MCF8443174.1 ATP-dependent helicase [Saprospiraceae bacterium]
FIGTIHGFALEILKRRRHLLGYGEMPHIIERENDRKKILEQVFLENPTLRNYYDGKASKEKLKMLDNYLKIISDEKRNLAVIDEDTPLPNWNPERQILYTSYNRVLREQNLIDFDDLLLLAWRVLNENPNDAKLYRRIYQYVLVDEAQDLNYAQYHLIKTLCGETHHNVFMVGDPNQSIHGYAGADKKFMLEDFVQDFGAEKKEIHHNYRSSQAVIDFAGKLSINGVSHSAFYKGEAAVFACPDELAEAKWIVSKIKEIVSLNEHEEIEGKITLDKIAVLARNRYVFNTLQKCLKQDDFFDGQFFMKKGVEALDMETRLMKLFDLGTRVLCNPANQVHFQQILHLLKIENLNGVSAETGLSRLEKLSSYVSDEKTKIELALATVAWQKVNCQQPQMTDALSILEKYLETELPNEESTLLHFDIAEYKQTWDKFLHSQSGNISLSAFRQFAAMGFNNQRPNQRGLTLASVHMMKGLEFDIVFVMGMNEGTFPDYRAKDDNKMEEEKNNAYVAFTRARRWLYVTYPLQKQSLNGQIWRQKKSRFLNGITEVFVNT